MILLTVPTVLRQTGTPTAHDCLKLLVSWLTLLHRIVAPDEKVVQKAYFNLGMRLYPDGPYRPSVISTLFFLMIVEQLGVE